MTPLLIYIIIFFEQVMVSPSSKKLPPLRSTKRTQLNRAIQVRLPQRKGGCSLPLQPFQFKNTIQNTKKSNDLHKHSFSTVLLCLLFVAILAYMGLAVLEFLRENISLSIFLIFLVIQACILATSIFFSLLHHQRNKVSDLATHHIAHQFNPAPPGEKTRKKINDVSKGEKKKTQHDPLRKKNSMQSQRKQILAQFVLVCGNNGYGIISVVVYFLNGDELINGWVVVFCGFNLGFALITTGYAIRVYVLFLLELERSSAEFPGTPSKNNPSITIQRAFESPSKEQPNPMASIPSIEKMISPSEEQTISYFFKLKKDHSALHDSNQDEKHIQKQLKASCLKIRFGVKQEKEVQQKKVNITIQQNEHFVYGKEESGDIKQIERYKKKKIKRQQLMQPIAEITSSKIETF